MANRRAATTRTAQPPTARRPQPTPTQHSAIPTWLIVTGIFLCTFITYLPAIRGDFIWDDDAHITRPEMASLHGLGRIWFDLKATQQYYPLLHSAFWVQYHLWGETPGTSPPGYHVVNILLHATNACLFMLLLKRLKIPGATLAAFIFALHPVMVESVAWITEMKNTLSTVFYLGSALVYLRFDQQRSARLYAIALFLFLCGLASKTVIATLPAALLVIFWWQRGRLSLKRDVLPLVPWLIVGAAAGLFTAWVERNLIGAQGQAFELTFLQRVLIAARAIWFYLGKLVWPSDLIFIYPRWEVDPRDAWQWAFLFAAVALLVGLWLIRKRTRAPLAAMLIFIGTLFPVLGFFNVFPFVYSFVADHFQYQASLAIIALAAAGITLLIRRLPETWPLIARACAIVLVLLLATLSFAQSGMYSDLLVLYATTVDRNPQCWMAHMNLGTLLQNNPDTIDIAQAHLEEALRINPGLAEARQNLGAVYQQKGEYVKAIEQWKRVTESWPDDPAAFSNLAMLYATCPDPTVRNPAEAVKLARKSVDVSNQQDAQAWAVLGVAYAESGQIPSAIDAATKALDLARAANNKDMAGRIEAHLAHYHELQRTSATQPATAP